MRVGGFPILLTLKMKLTLHRGKTKSAERVFGEKSLEKDHDNCGGSVD
jgi:hypothetical protein